MVDVASYWSNMNSNILNPALDGGESASFTQRAPELNWLFPQIETLSSNP